MTYDGDIHYKLDFNQAGGYLSLQVQFNDYHFVSLSAFDFDVQISGEDTWSVTEPSGFGAVTFGPLRSFT